jgi:DNA modification methylase
VQDEQLSTAEVARMAGVHRDTLLRWLRGGLVQEPQRDRNGWRFFTPEQAKSVVGFAQSGVTSNTTHPKPHLQVPTPVGRLKDIDFDFTGAKTSYLTHGIHPYPAKFIPQIPNALIQELSSVGDTVGDIFCGSGTTLVEALTLKRHAVGIDANPLACLVSRAKTSLVDGGSLTALADLAARARSAADDLAPSVGDDLFAVAAFKSTGWRPDPKVANFWFLPHVVEELAECLEWCRHLPDRKAQELALVAFSSIVVAASLQDSDTRYVRRDKKMPPGEAFRRFARALEQTARMSEEFGELVEPRFRCDVVQASLLDEPRIPKLDLMVCSPPYPNAYSYHLYHMTRMVWLGMDQPRFKREEIGSHRKYSSKSKEAPNVATFVQEFESILKWLADNLKRSGFACFVVGDSTIRGERVDNAALIERAGESAGFRRVLQLERTMQATKKAFNPAIGKIKTEKILILERL